jgi:hypothetical protein
MIIYVILNGAQRSEESRAAKKKRFFAALRMTNNSLLIARSLRSSGNEKSRGEARQMTFGRLPAPPLGVNP